MMRGKTTGNLKERGKIEGEQMAASPEILWKGDREGRKVRAPQGRVVRNTDCFCEKPISQGQGKCHRNIPPAPLGGEF